ncbi:GNAT family N-acetyltransferase [Sporobolomyces koalae]|uniref:GNAT family N-acetyltransferase n=1 Tax=Sporobolomyces koalae TaxID=500713 RepID=UPI003173E64B
MQVALFSPASGEVSPLDATAGSSSISPSSRSRSGVSVGVGAREEVRESPESALWANLRFLDDRAALRRASRSMIVSSSAIAASSSVPFHPALSVPHEIRTVIKRKQESVATTAVAFHHSVLHTQLVDGTIQLRLNSLDPTAPPYDQLSVNQALWNALFKYFARGKDVAAEMQVEPVLPSPELHHALLSLGATQTVPPQYTISRSAVFQLFHHATDSHEDPSPSLFPYIPVTPASNAPSPLTYPLRPAKPSNARPIYSRYIPHLSPSPSKPTFFSLNLLSLRHLPTLHSWMNDSRVDAFWMEAGDMDKHKAFIEANLQDKHTLGVIGSYTTMANGFEGEHDVQDAVYAEIYWGKEDRLGPLLPKEVEVRDYDRGIHMLVGSSTHRGPDYVRAWLPSLAHYCFISDPRTERVLCEPNEKNQKMVSYLESIGFKQHGTVTFPHKVSALMILEKKDFYELCPF